MDKEIRGAGRQRVLVVSPLTFSYHLAICEALENLGYQPVWWNDKASMSTAYKIALRLLPKFTRFLTQKHFLRLIEKWPRGSFASILIIKGEGLNSFVVQKIREHYAGASLGLYLWDSVDNVKGIGEIIPQFDTISSFDPVDAKENGWRYRPLFAREVAINVADNLDAVYDWCFVGTIHSDRHKVISRLRRTAGSKSRNFVFAYFQSPTVMYLRKLFDWSLWAAPSGTLSTIAMPAAEIAQVVARSRAVLDIEHPRQRGLTMRTIETLLSGKKLLSTNRHLLACDLYDVSRAQMIDRRAPCIDKAFLDSPAKPVPVDIRARYSCEAWISELLEAQDLAHAQQSKVLLS